MGTSSSRASRAGDLCPAQVTVCRRGGHAPGRAAITSLSRICKVRAEPLQQPGYAVGEEGDWARAQQLLQESVRLSRDLGDEQHALPCSGSS